jgi:hypothetical protein
MSKKRINWNKISVFVTIFIAIIVIGLTIYYGDNNKFHIDDRDIVDNKNANNPTTLIGENLTINMKSPERFIFYGSNISGSSGTKNRTLNVSKVNRIVVDYFELVPNLDYNFKNGIITFLNPIWDEQTIIIWK